MLAKIIVKIALFSLKCRILSGEQKAAVTSALLDNMLVVPIKDIVKIDETGTLLLNGKNLDLEQAIMFKDSVVSLKNSYARKFINQQITFNAINLGVHSGMNTDMIVFSKAALWVIQEEEKLLSTIAQDL